MSNDNYVFTVAPSSDAMGINHNGNTTTCDLFFLHADGSVHGTIAGLAVNVASALGAVINTVATGGSHPQSLGGVSVDVATLSGRASVVLNGTYYLDNAASMFPNSFIGTNAYYGPGTTYAQGCAAALLTLDPAWG